MPRARRDRLTAPGSEPSAARAQIARERDTSMYEELQLSFLDDRGNDERLTSNW